MRGMHLILSFLVFCAFIYAKESKAQGFEAIQPNGGQTVFVDSGGGERFTIPDVPLPSGYPIRFASSPRDATRTAEAIPTLGLCLWHHWLVSREIRRAQIEYGFCVGRLEERYGNVRNGPSATFISSLLSYDVPFEAVEPATLPNCRAHFVAGIATLDFFMDHVDACSRGL